MQLLEVSDAVRPL